MYTFDLSPRFLTRDETEAFTDHLNYLGIGERIWEVFSCLFETETTHSSPYLLRVYKDSLFCGAAIFIRCSKYGRSLFDNQLLAGLVDFVDIPFYLWLKFGCCMDMMSNPGFVSDPDKADEVCRAISNYMSKNTILTIVTDYNIHSGQHSGATTLPALPHALLDTIKYNSVHDYIKEHKNLKRKIRVFKNKGGTFSRTTQRLAQDQLADMKNCFQRTADKSLFYLPYQDLYLSAALNTTQTSIEDIHYFIATLNGKFLGYQAAIKSGNRLNALHGAFNRKLKTTHHAYDILFVKMVEFALMHNLHLIDFGAILNFTKEKMINSTHRMSYFILSKYALVRQVFKLILKKTKIQRAELMKFSG